MYIESREQGVAFSAFQRERTHFFTGIQSTYKAPQ